MKECRPKRTIIEEVKYLNTLFINDLIGSLISYKKDLVSKKGDEDKMKKNIALKASRIENNDKSEFHRVSSS